MAWDGRHVAPMVRFPVIIVVSGIAEPGWVTGFEGAASEPQSITVRYGHPWTAAEVQVSTYPGNPFGDLAELVDSWAGGEWWAMTHRPARPPAGERRGRRTLTFSKVDQPRPKVLAAQRARARAIREAVQAAGKRDMVMSTDGVATNAYSIEMPGLAAVGLHVDRPQELTVVLVARGVDPESLELVATTDVAGHVGDKPVI